MHDGISAIILSGGKGRRMGQQNKGLIQYHSQPMIQHVIDRIAPQVDDIVISANLDIKAYERFGYPVVTDQTESAGPLTGILSASAACQHTTILVVPCDMPLLPTDLVDRLLAAMTTDAVSICSDGQEQPLVSLINSKAMSEIEIQLKQGDGSVKAWLRRIRGTNLAWDDHPEAFRNLNHTSDLTT